MTTQRYPVLVWRDAGGLWGGCLACSGDAAAAGGSDAAVLGQLRDYLAWRARQGRALAAPELEDVALVTVRVDVRPEYQVEGRVLPCDEPIRFDVPCVRGRAGGLVAVDAPLLGVRFYAYEGHAAGAGSAGGGHDRDLAQRAQRATEGAARGGSAAAGHDRDLAQRGPASPRERAQRATEGDSLRDLVEHYVRQALRGRTPQELSRRLAPGLVALREVTLHVAARPPRRAGFETRALSAVADPVGVGVRRRASRPFGRDAEVKELVRRLTHERSSVLLVGAPGCGKSTVLAAAVREVERRRRDLGGGDGEAGHGGRPQRFWATSGGRLVAGAPYLGQWQERTEAAVEELGRVGGVLCLEGLLEVVLAGGRTPLDGVAAFLVPFLQHGELRLVAETTPAEVDACRRLLPGLVELFTVLALDDLDRAASLAALRRLGEACARHTHVEPERGAVETAHRLFLRFCPYDALPGRASGWLRDQFELAERARRAELRVRDVVDAFVRRTGLSDALVRDEVSLSREQVVAELSAAVIGQEEACDAAADVVLALKAGLNDPARPLGVLLFCGPTGVGKTALARALAHTLFGHGGRPGEAPGRADESRLVRLDMSEYAGPLAVSRLVGGREPSELVRRAREQPFFVLLLDEVEKAGPDVFDALLGLLDEGRLTDAYGRTTTFRSAVVVMTSNLGADRDAAVGFADRPATTYEHEVRAFFRPELFNRLDRVVAFRPLGAAAIRQVAERELAELGRREGLTRLGLRLTWTDALVARVVELGFDRRYGARPLQRALETLLVAPLARLLVERADLRDAEVRADVDAATGELRLTVDTCRRL